MDGVTSAAVEVLVQNLIDVLVQEYHLLHDVEEHVQQLQETLGLIQAYLNDAEKKSITDDAVKIWVRQLESLAFDADNVLDEFSYHLLHKKFKKMKRKVPSCFSPFKRIAHRRNIAHAIKQINTDFESMNKKASDLGIKTMIVNSTAAAPLASLETDSLSLDPIFIGRDKDMVKLVELVIESPLENKLSILAIVGMGGLGKTSLTREVFNHPKMEARFGSFIWVHVSQEFDPIVLFKKILSNFPSSSSTPVGVDESRQALLIKLKEALKDKTYLLVLDDIWNEDAHKWGDFMNSISAVTSTEGNVIIMSSRKEDVVSIVRPFRTHFLSVLSDEECWSIIKAKAFESGEVPSSGFERIGREIAKRCKGLPLAANVVGGLLLGYKSEQEWGLVNQDRLSDVEGGETILKILKLSYDHLASPSLKKCFAYCSIFPKGRNIMKQELIEMWMAEGFLKAGGRNEESMESVGDKFINVLLHNSLLLVSKRDEYGNVEMCVMHDLVHDVASFALGSSNSLRYKIHDSTQPIPKQVAKHLRTLVLEGDVSGTTFSDCESLRVLTLNYYRVKELPIWIRKLKHLRSLNISRTSIEELPEWIGELHHLETLSTYGTMKKMPSMLEYLTNLSHLYIHSNYFRKFPTEIGRFTSLQTLEKFRVGDEKGYRIEELKSLKSLKGKVEICDLEKVHGKEEAEKADMSHKPNLLHLTLIWGDSSGEGERNNDESVLEGLQPHPNLKKLEIDGFKGEKFPSWVEKMAVRDGAQGAWLPLNILIEMTLNGCSECEEIPRLEHLPNLKSLVLRGMKKVSFINSPFTTKLMSLCIEDLEGLERLPDRLFYDNPNLSKLKIRECPKLRELPDGMHTLISLEELIIEGCPDLKSIGNNNINNSPWKSKGRVLRIEECTSMKELPHQMMESWAPSLEKLELVGLSSLNNLPMLIDCLAKSSTSLEYWNISGVPHYSMAAQRVESWPFEKLVELDIGDVSEEGSVERMLQGCTSHSLKYLSLKGAEDWEKIPESIQHLTRLEWLRLENMGMKELPEWLGNLTSLGFLYLIRCKKLRRQPPGDAYKSLTELRCLYIKGCPELQVDSVWRDMDLTILEYP